MFSRPLDWIIGQKWFLVGAAVAVLIAFGWGYISGSAAVTDSYAQAQQKAVQEALVAQATKAAADRQAAVADALKRAKAEEVVQTKVETVYRDRVKYVSNPCKTKVPVTAVRNLNDIGRAQ